MEKKKKKQRNIILDITLFHKPLYLKAEIIRSVNIRKEMEK